MPNQRGEWGGRGGKVKAKNKIFFMVTPVLYGPKGLLGGITELFRSGFSKTLVLVKARF